MNSDSLKDYQTRKPRVVISTMIVITRNVYSPWSVN